jgi:hypothetical protein
MCCSDGSNVFLTHVAAIRRGAMQSHPLTLWLLVPLVACLALFLWSVVATDVRGRAAPSADQITS